jgi:putative Ca2+/H+ antiporter (TMEM165/GDT1 family)
MLATLVPYLSIFWMVFLAEFADKTQLAVFAFSTDNKAAPLGVFLASSLALALSSALAVYAGSTLSRHLEHVPLQKIAAVIMIAYGVWMLVRK